MGEATSSEPELSIAFVLDGGIRGGGAERVATSLIAHWAERGIRVHLITRRDLESDFYRVPAKVERVVLGGVVRSRNKLFGLLNNVTRVMDLRRALKESKAGVVIAFMTRPNIRTVIASAGLRKRVVISERNDSSRQPFDWPWRWLRRLVYRHADVVTANSRVALLSMQGYVPKQKLVFVPNPVVFPDKASSLQGSTTILNVSRLVSHKAQHVLIEALARLESTAQDWWIEILGEGPERAKLTQLARKLGVNNRVRLRGLVADPSPYYSSGGMFVLPSLFEGTPNALLEAMAHGLPCIVADCLSGALEHVEEGKSGLVFRSGDADDLAAKIAMLIQDDSLRTRLGSSARERMRAFASSSPFECWNAVLRSAK